MWQCSRAFDKQEHGCQATIQLSLLTSKMVQPTKDGAAYQSHNMRAFESKDIQDAECCFDAVLHVWS